MTTPEMTRQRFIEELIGTASMLDGVEQAAIAEAWASGAVAEWIALDGQMGSLSALVAPSSAVGASVIAWIEGGPEPSGPPDWLDDVGRHELVRAARLGSAGASDHAIILEYVAPSGTRHDVSVAIDNGGVAGVSVGPEGLALAAAEHAEVDVEEVDCAEGLAEVRAVLTMPRDELSASSEASMPLLCRRVGSPLEDLGSSSPLPVDRPLPERSAEDDRYAADVVRSALRGSLDNGEPTSVTDALASFRALVDASDADALTIFEIAGLVPPSNPNDLQVDDLVKLVGAYLSPVSLAPHSPEQFDALAELEPADWVGVVLGMSRAATGIDIDGPALVQFINRCPEITTSIPKRDAPRLAWAFEQMLYGWETTGVLSDSGSLTDAARWLLPRAALAAWGS